MVRQLGPSFGIIEGFGLNETLSYLTLLFDSLRRVETIFKKLVVFEYIKVLMNEKKTLI